MAVLIKLVESKQSQGQRDCAFRPLILNALIDRFPQPGCDHCGCGTPLRLEPLLYFGLVNLDSVKKGRARLGNCGPVFHRVKVRRPKSWSQGDAAKVDIEWLDGAAERRAEPIQRLPQTRLGLLG